MRNLEEPLGILWNIKVLLRGYFEEPWEAFGSPEGALGSLGKPWEALGEAWEALGSHGVSLWGSIEGNLGGSLGGSLGREVGTLGEP